MAGSLLITVFFFHLLTDSFIEKFDNLVHQLRDFLDIENNDDITLLVTGFDTMKKRIGNLKSEIYEAEINRKDMQIRLLQAKIKPHFLYNNLSAINWIALENGQTKICEIVTSLSAFYRSALNQGKEMSSLKTELTNAKAYMTLQILAHNGALCFAMDVQKEIKDIEVPGFIIQPLLENAIEHGTDRIREGAGQIKLCVSVDDRLLYIFVLDNGIELYKKIGNSMLAKDQFGYGLSNVDQRIRLLYGNTYGVTVRAGPEGTRASLVMPPNYRWLMGTEPLADRKQTNLNDLKAPEAGQQMLIKEDNAMDSALKAANVMRYPADAKYRAGNRKWQGIPSIERTAKGRLYVNFYTGMKTEEPGNFVVLVHSDDDGNTWTDAEIVIEHSDPACRCFDSVLWQDPLGRLWFAWTQSKSFYDGRHGVWVIISEDPDAETPHWSEPRRIANGLMLNKPLITSKGEWLFPCALWSHEYAKPAEEHPELAGEIGSNVYVSVDQGDTFTYRGGVEIEDRAFDEHMLIEKKDGRLWMLVRTTYGIGESFSDDWGKTWTAGKDTGLPGPNSRFYIRRLASGRLLLVTHEPNGMDKSDEIYRKRTNLCAKLSDDDGKTWKGGLMLDERNSVSYPDGAQDEKGVIYIVYDRERYKDRELLMAMFTEEDILAGTCMSPHAKLKVLVSKAEGALD
jgi:hypothetical protein